MPFNKKEAGFATSFFKEFILKLSAQVDLDLCAVFIIHIDHDRVIGRNAVFQRTNHPLQVHILHLGRHFAAEKAQNSQ